MTTKVIQIVEFQRDMSTNFRECYGLLQIGKMQFGMESGSNSYFNTNLVHAVFNMLDLLSNVSTLTIHIGILGRHNFKAQHMYTCIFCPKKC